jgi:hypothetical protein
MWFHVSIIAMRVLTDPVGPGLVAFSGPENGDRFTADPEKHVCREGRSWPYGRDALGPAVVSIPGR